MRGHIGRVRVRVWQVKGHSEGTGEGLAGERR